MIICCENDVSYKRTVGDKLSWSCRFWGDIKIILCYSPLLYWNSDGQILQMLVSTNRKLSSVSFVGFIIWRYNDLIVLKPVSSTSTLFSINQLRQWSDDIKYLTFGWRNTSHVIIIMKEFVMILSYEVFWCVWAVITLEIVKFDEIYNTWL